MAAIPIEVACPANQWQILATNVLTGTIHKLSVSPNVYRMVTRPTGGASPTDDTGAWLTFDGSNSVAISDTAPIDVYIKSVKVDGKVSVVL